MINLGNAISKIRKDKNIPVRHLIKGCMSRSTYTRFIEGDIELSGNKLDVIINRLNLSWYEFEYIEDNYGNNSFFNINNKIQSALLRLDITRVSALEQKLYSKFKQNQNNKYNKYIMPIKHYLLSRYTWTFYELSLFNDSLLAFNTTTIKIFITRVLNDLKKYNNFQNNENECVRLLINIALIFINRKDLIQAIKLINILNTSTLKDGMILEKLLIKYLNGILLIIDHKKEGFTLIKNSMICFKITNQKSYYPAITHNYYKVLKIYKIKNRI